MTRPTPEGISLQQLRALAAVSETGSFTLAAERLQLTQPAVSHLIKRIEQEIGQSLLVRGRRIGLTVAGRMMTDTAVRALRLIDDSVEVCRSSAHLREGRVVLAVGHLTAGALLPPLLARFAAAYPQLAVTLMDGSAEQMKARILSREADLGFGADIGQRQSELATETLFSEPLALFVRNDHPLAQRPSVEARRLAELPFIHVNPDAEVWQAVAERLAGEAGVQPQAVHHVAMLSTAFGLIHAGAGVALLPRYVSVLAPPDVCAVAVERPALHYPVVAVRLAKHPLGPGAQAFLAMARQHMRPARTR